MFFKALSLVLVLISMTSCSWWGGENNKKEALVFSEAQVLGTSSDCVDHIGSFFKEYFKGESEKRDIVENISCIKDVTSKIFKHASEQDIEKGFSRSEINTVLTTVFPLRDKKKLNKNIDLLFLFKRMFVGGHKDGFSRDEKKKFDKALDSLQTEMLLSLYNIEYIFFPKGVSLAVRDEAYVQMKKSFEKIDELRTLNKGVVTQKELSSLIEHIFDKDSSLHQYKDIAYTCQKFLLGDDEVFSRSEPELFRRIFSVLEMQSRARSIDFSEGFLFGESYYDLRNSLAITSKKLSSWSDQDKEYKVKVVDFKNLLKRLHALGVLSNLFTDPEIMNQSLEKFLIKIFKSKEYGHKEFKRFEVMARDWSRRQNRIISGFDFLWASGRVDGLTKDSSLLLDEIKSFKVPQFKSPPGLPILIKRDDEVLSNKEKYFDLSLKHSLYTVVYVFFQAYSRKGRNSKNNTEFLSKKYKSIFKNNFDPDTDMIESEFNLNLSETKAVFDDLRPLALEMGFANPHTCNTQNRSFVEADSLTINGNGDDSLSINEAVEWMGTMISVGSITSHMMSQVEEKCSYSGMKNLGFSFVSRKCIQKELFSKNSLLFSYFPEAFSYLETLNSGSRRKKFQEDLGSVGSLLLGIELGKEGSYNESFTSSGNTCGQKDFPVSKGELSVSVAISVYMENVFFQFDKTGIRSPLNNAWRNDPEGPDYILDGEEISNFISKKLKAPIANYKKSLSEKNKYLKPFVLDRLLKIPESLRERTLKLDRVGTHQFIKKVTGMFTQEPHPFAKKYCEDVYASFKKAVVYRKEDRLSCLPSETKQ